MNEETATAIMMGNLRGSKNKPSNLLEFGEACRFWTRKIGVKDTAKRFKVSQTMIRRIDKINEIDDPKLRQMIKEGKFKIEASYHLWRIKEPKRSQAAKILKDMATEDIRRFMYFIIKNPLLSIKECKELLDSEKPKNMSLLMLPIDSTMYSELEQEAKRKNLKTRDYILKLLIRRKRE